MGKVDGPGALIDKSVDLVAATNDLGRSQCSMDDISKSEVNKVVRSINVSKSSCLDNISSSVIKIAFETLEPVVTYLYNLSIRTTTFPDLWKKALMTSCITYII